MLSVFLLCFSALPGCERRPDSTYNAPDRAGDRIAETGVPAPTLDVPRVADFGVALPGQTLHGEIVVRNTSTRDVAVRDVRASCACTVPGVRSFAVPAGGSYTLPLSITPSCPDKTTAFVRLLTGPNEDDGVTFWISGTCRNPFADNWLTTGDPAAAFVPFTDGFDPELLERVTCYWYPSDDAATARIDPASAGLIVEHPPGHVGDLDIVYVLKGFTDTVVQRVAGPSAPDAAGTDAAGRNADGANTDSAKTDKESDHE